MKLIEIHADLEGETSNPNKGHQREDLSKVALIHALRVITKGTKLESETEDLIETCEKHLYKNK